MGDARPRDDSSSSSDEYDDEDDELVSALLASRFLRGAQPSPGPRGSTPGRRFIERDHEAGYNAIMRDYFAEAPIYHDTVFESRFRMPKSMFLKILADIERRSVYPTNPDCTGRPPIHPLVRMTAAVRLLAYGLPADSVDEYTRISKDTARASLWQFCEHCVSQYADQYLRAPSAQDLIAIYRSNAEVGFPGLIGSIDCTHIQWKNCSKAEQGLHKGKEKASTLILEAVATSDTWIWHSFFGLAGALNDINVLDQSPILDGIFLSGSAQNNVLYRLNGKQRRQQLVLFLHGVGDAVEALYLTEAKLLILRQCLRTLLAGVTPPVSIITNAA